MIIVRRQDDGSWKIARLITHGDQPPASSEKSVFCPDEGPISERLLSCFGRGQCGAGACVICLGHDE